MDLTTEDILKSITAQQKSQQLPMQPLGMPGPSDLINMARNASGGIANYGQDVFGRMKRAVTQGPYSSPTGEYDPSIGTLPLEIMMPGYGRAAGVASSGGKFRSSLSSGGSSGFFTPEVRESMARIKERLGDSSHKEFVQAFRQRFPDYKGTDETVRRQLSRNETRGVEASYDTELGAFGGRGRLNTDSPGEAVNRLQEQIPVTKQWVEQWAKDADVPIKEIKTAQEGRRKTSYIKMLDDQGKNVTVRVPAPNDYFRHIGYPIKDRPGSFFDTGTGIIREPSSTPVDQLSKSKQFFSGPGEKGETLVPKYAPHEPNLINESGMSYANPEALDAALKWRFSKAPRGGNWLIPEEMAPRTAQAPVPNQAPKQRSDPNQLKLLSGGFTPYDILKILEQQQNGAK